MEELYQRTSDEIDNYTDCKKSPWKGDDDSTRKMQVKRKFS